MVAHVTTVAFLGLEARSVDVQVQIAKGGMNAFNVVGLPDKAVNESKERVRAALSAIGLALPFQRITVNLSPADLPKEGSHFDLAIALGLLAAMGVVDAEALSQYVVFGELSPDGRLAPVPGVLLAALHASENDLGYFLSLQSLSHDRSKCYFLCCVSCICKEFGHLSPSICLRNVVRQRADRQRILRRSPVKQSSTRCVPLPLNSRKGAPASSSRRPSMHL